MNVTMTEGQLAAATRRAGVRLPFPFQDSGAAVVPVGEAGRQIGPALTAIAAPRTTVYAVVLRHDAGAILHVAAVSAPAGSWTLEVVRGQATMCRVERHGLVQAVVRSVSSFGATSDDALLPRETVIPARELASSGADGVAGHRPGRPTSTGTLGVVDVADGSPRHSRSATWRVYRDGGVLVVEAPARRRREPSITVQAPSEHNLTRAALTLLSGLNAVQRTSGEHGRG